MPHRRTCHTPPCSPDPGPLVAWPGPRPAELADGSLVLAATAPRPGLVVVRAVGEIDVLTAPAWRRLLLAAVPIVTSPSPPGRRDPGVTDHGASGGTPRLVCDLSAVTFFGATGLSVLVDLVAHAEEHGVDLRLVAPEGGGVDRQLELSGLARRAVLHRRLDRAVSPTPGATAAGSAAARGAAARGADA